MFTTRKCETGADAGKWYTVVIERQGTRRVGYCALGCPATTHRRKRWLITCSINSIARRTCGSSAAPRRATVKSAVRRPLCVPGWAATLNSLLCAASTSRQPACRNCSESASPSSQSRLRPSGPGDLHGEWAPESAPRPCADDSRPCPYADCDGQSRFGAARSQTIEPTHVSSTQIGRERTCVKLSLSRKNGLSNQ